MRRWKPQPSWRLLAALVALVAAAAGLIVVALPITSALTGPPAEWLIDGNLFLRGLGSLALLILTFALAYRAVAAFTLAYTLDRNGLYVLWLGNRAVVPLHEIERIERGLSAPVSRGSPLGWLGYLHGRARLADGRTLHRFSTQSLARALVVHTTSAAYAISPQEADAFVQDLEQRRRIGAVQQLTPGVEAGQVFLYAFWEDHQVQAGLLIAALLNLALVGGLMVVYPGLPPLIDLRADATGALAALAPRHQILFLPLAGLASGLLNVAVGLAIYQREPVGARLLQIGAAVVQLLFIVAALTILR